MSSELRKYGSTSVVQTSNIGFTSEVSDYLVVHTGPGWVKSFLCILMSAALMAGIFTTAQTTVRCKVVHLLLESACVVCDSVLH